MEKSIDAGERLCAIEFDGHHFQTLWLNISAILVGLIIFSWAVASSAHACSHHGSSANTNSHASMAQSGHSGMDDHGTAAHGSNQGNAMENHGNNTDIHSSPMALVPDDNRNRTDGSGQPANGPNHKTSATDNSQIPMSDDFFMHL